MKPIVAILCTSLVFSLVGCEAAPSQPTVTLWHGWGGNELSALRKIITAYHQANPEIEVITLPVPFKNLRNKFETATAANGGPDLVIGNIDWVGKFADAGLIAPLDHLMTPAVTATFAQTALDAVRYKGHSYALPESLESVALYYNKALLPSAPDSLQQLIDAAPKRPKDTYPFVLNVDFYFSAGLLFAHGGQIFGSDGNIAIDSPESRRWLETLQKLNQVEGFILKSDYGKADALFKEGKAGAIINGPWALSDYEKALGDRLGVALLPKVAGEGTEMLPFVGVKCLMFSTNPNDEQRQRAFHFAQFMTSTPMAELLLKEAGHLPSNRLVKAANSAAQSVFIAQTQRGKPLPVNPAMELVWEPMGKAIDRVLTGDASPDEAISEAQRVLTAKQTQMNQP